MSTLDISASAGRLQGAQRRARLLRSAIICILGPTLLYALYLILIAPPQYHTSASFAIRGAQASTSDALSALGIVAPTSNSADAMVVENFIRSDAMVAQLREKYGFNTAYGRFSLDPTAHLSPKASLKSARAFWRHKVEVVSDPNTAGATIHVSAFSPEDSVRLARGVLAESERLVNSLPNRALSELIRAADEQVAVKREQYDDLREGLADYQGRQYSGIDSTAPAQQAIALVGSIESQLAQKRTELATARQTYQPGAPQLAGLEREIAALEGERDLAIQRAAQAPGERAASSDIQAQTLLAEFQLAQQEYQAAVRAAESVRRQQVIDRKYIVSYIPPQTPQGSDWWARLLNIIAVLIGTALIWGICALVYSIVRDHAE